LLGTVTSSRYGSSSALSLAVDLHVFPTDPVKWLASNHPEWVKHGKLLVPLGLSEGEDFRSTAFVPAYAIAHLLQVADTGRWIVLSVFLPSCPVTLPPIRSDYSPACFLQ